jgi:hypothetical protein
MCFHLGRFDGEGGVDCLLPVLGILWLFCLRSGLGWDGTARACVGVVWCGVGCVAVSDADGAGF